ncbi:MAG: hypothetical protein J0I28_08485 [Caulobacterales bacterium]|nr:hypothetical protein [Caulobacterales bacterium]
MTRPTLPPVRYALLAVLVPLLAACNPDTSAWTSGKAAPATPSSGEAGYIAPPRITGVFVGSDRLTLTGSARASSRVRLGPPAGEATFATADSAGAFTVVLPRSADVRLFGLSMAVGDRAVQSEGYLMVLPDGQLLQLRAGGGAWSLAPASPQPRLLTVDHDGEGGAIISGSAPANAQVSARIDRSTVAGGKSGPDGHFDIALSEPLRPGPHSIDLVADSGRDSLTVPISRAEPLLNPFRGQRTDFGWRVDWMTPAGGIQTTLVFDRGGQP